ncbi:MAG: ATP-dependent helicase [Bacteroidales bacterium]|nr:ATP-dependent helicase [Bacteroidales bacterium]
MKNTPSFLNGLNSEQLEVATTIEGPVLCIAGPGSGKTKTLVDRVVYLISKGNAPENILVSTFTEKAAKELLTRISNRLIELKIDVNPNELYIGTLHSIFLHFLEDYSQYTRLKRFYRLLDPFEQAFIIYRNYNSFAAIDNIDSIIDLEHGKWSNTQTLVSRINNISEEDLDVKALANSNDAAIVALSECYARYCEILEEENAIDFSSIQTEILRMITDHPEALAGIQEKVKYFMIDEYQDTNRIQEKILLRLASQNNNICVVGDDDQGLYRFRGASIRNILQFASNFNKGECREIYLTTNYRSYPGIVQFYDTYMASQKWTDGTNKFRFDKTIEPYRSSCGTSSVVRLSSTDSFEDYRKRVLDFITILRDKHIITDYNQICFLYKSVKSDKALELMQYLEENGIPVFSPRSGLFFKRPEVKLLIGALFNLFPQLLEKGTVSNLNAEYLEDCNKSLLQELEQNAAANKDLIAWIWDKKRIHANLKKNTDYAFSGLVYQLFQFPLFAKYLQTELTASKQDLRPAYNIGILVSLICKFEYLYNIDIFSPKRIDSILKLFFNVYLYFVLDGGLEEFEDFDEITPSGNISFMTIHQSKGLEFPITVVGSMGDIPRKRYNDFDKLLQEQYYDRPAFEPIEETKMFDFYRLYYTAFSRAENLLVLTGWEHKQRGHGSVPSKFHKGIWQNTPEWDSPSANFDLSKLKLDEVKPVNIKHEYSFTSHVLLYERCPLQYKFFKELGFAAVRVGATIAGTLLHNTIEDIHKAVLRGESNTLTQENIERWFDTNYRLLVKSEHAYLAEPQRNAILSYVFNYTEQQAGHWDRIKEAEVDVSLVKQEYILKGTIDLIEGENGKIDIIDFKSGNKPDVNSFDPHEKQILSQYKRQLEVYAHILEGKGYKINDLRLYYPKETNGNPCITFHYDPKNVAETIKTFDSVVAKIESKDFSMKNVKCNPKQCLECDMRHFCHK